MEKKLIITITDDGVEINTTINNTGFKPFEIIGLLTIALDDVLNAHQKSRKIKRGSKRKPTSK